MKKKIVCIFGYKGGIGQATKNAFLSAGFQIIPVYREVLDLNAMDADGQINSLLTNGKPDVIINAAGVFNNGWDYQHHEIFNVNVGSNWSILKHYMNSGNQTKPVRIIMIGSSSYSYGRKLYPLYSASKAALYNLWQGASEAVADTNITIDLLNPARTLTKMSTVNKKIDSNLDYLKPEQVADKIITLVEENQPSRCIDMTFEDAK